MGTAYFNESFPEFSAFGRVSYFQLYLPSTMQVPSAHLKSFQDV